MAQRVSPLRVPGASPLPGRRHSCACPEAAEFVSRAGPRPRGVVAFPRQKPTKVLSGAPRRRSRLDSLFKPAKAIIKKSIKFAAVAAASAIAAVVVSLSAFAEGATYEDPQPMTSRLTRVEVRTDLVAAQTNHQLASGVRAFAAELAGLKAAAAELFASGPVPDSERPPALQSGGMRGRAHHDD